MVLYTRYEHGNESVRVQDDPERAGGHIYLLGGGDSAPPRTFRSARQLLITVTGHPKARNWTFDRYFKTGSHEVLTVSPTLEVADLFGGLDEAITVSPAIHRRLGIDLECRSHEVAKLLFAGFGSQIHAAGFDPDDVLQEVYRGLLARNIGKCPWDERKSSFGHYVYMVCRCVLSNYGRKQRRVRSIEQVGLLSYEDGSRCMVDVATVASDELAQEAHELNDEMAQEDFKQYLLKRERHSPDAKLAVRILPLVTAGHTRTEMTALTGAARTALSRALSILRHHVTTWAAGQRQLVSHPSH